MRRVTDDDAIRAARRSAEGLLRAGRSDAAIEAYHALLAHAPGSADDWFNLAWLLRGAQRFDEALRAYDEALSRGIARPEEVHLNRAVIRSEELGDVAGAERDLHLAVQRNPGFTLAWLNLGNLHEDVGNVEAAREAYEKALVSAPGHGRALARLTAIDLFAGGAGARIETLRAAIQRPRDPEEAAELLFALGAALDAEGRYDEAFAAVAQGNRVVRDRLGPAGRYDPAAHERLIEGLIAAPALPPAPETGELHPIFICGMFRSGSTLAEQRLVRSGCAAAGGELDIVPRLVAERLGNDPARLGMLDAHEIAEFRRIYVDRVRMLLPDSRVVTDKRSDNFRYIGVLKAMFPAARIVHTVRDPVDTILSVFFLHFADSVRYGWALEDIAHWYRQYRRIMAHWHERHGADMIDLSYDALVRDPEPALATTLAFCGIPPRAAPDDATALAAPVRTASAWQVRQPLHRRSSGRWRHYPAAAAQIRRLIDGA